MGTRRLATALGTVALSLSLAVAVLLAGAVPAQAVTQAQKLFVLDSWTQTSADSQSAFLAARADQASWADYGYNWTTDLCTASPDQPFGWDFRPSCIRHDFGYSNYKQFGLFEQNKARVDTAFYQDLLRVCAQQSWWERGPCQSLAFVYYEAVKNFGSLASGVRKSDLTRTKAMLVRAEAAAASRSR
ncbi:phospholipase [Flindersiella endophytica]